MNNATNSIVNVNDSFLKMHLGYKFLIFLGHVLEVNSIFDGKLIYLAIWHTYFILFFIIELYH